MAGHDERQTAGRVSALEPSGQGKEAKLKVSVKQTLANRNCNCIVYFICMFTIYWTGAGGAFYFSYFPYFLSNDHACVSIFHNNLKPRRARVSDSVLAVDNVASVFCPEPLNPWMRRALHNTYTRCNLVID